VVLYVPIFLAEDIVSSSQLIVNILGIGVIAAGVFVFFYWWRIALADKFQLWHFIFWSPMMTRREVIRRCTKKESSGCRDDDQCEAQYVHQDPSGRYSQEGWNVHINVPAVTLRGQIVNPYPWPLMVKGALFSCVRFADENCSLIPFDQRPADETDQYRWNDAGWRLKFLGRSILPEDTAQAATAGLEFKVHEEFRPIIVDPRSHEEIELVFMPNHLLYCPSLGKPQIDNKKDKRAVQGSKAGTSPEMEIPVGLPRQPKQEADVTDKSCDHVLNVPIGWPKIEPGVYKCSLTLSRNRLLGSDEKLNFFCDIYETDVNFLKGQDKMGSGGYLSWNCLRLQEVENNTRKHITADLFEKSDPIRNVLHSRED